VDTLSTMFVSSLICACYKLFVCNDGVENVADIEVI